MDYGITIRCNTLFMQVLICAVDIKIIHPPYEFAIVSHEKWHQEWTCNPYIFSSMIHKNIFYFTMCNISNGSYHFRLFWMISLWLILVMKTIFNQASSPLEWVWISIMSNCWCCFYHPYPNQSESIGSI